MWDRQKTCGLAIFLIALVSFPGCEVTADHSGTTSTTPAATVTTTTTAVAASPPATTRTEKWVDLDIGDCLADAPPTDPSVVTVTLVECSTPHMAEVFFRGPLTVNAAVPEVADPACSAQFSKYTGQSLASSGLATTYLVDSNQDRTTADPTAGPAPSYVICLLQDANGKPLKHSVHR